MEGCNNGPDQILESDVYITTDRNAAVKLRLEEDDSGCEPISGLETLALKIAADFYNVTPRLFSAVFAQVRGDRMSGHRGPGGQMPN